MNPGDAHKMVQDARQDARKWRGLSDLDYSYSYNTSMLLLHTLLCLPLLLPCQNHRGQPELNRRPLDLQSNALPLSYIPNPCKFKQPFHTYFT